MIEPGADTPTPILSRISPKVFQLLFYGCSCCFLHSLLHIHGVGIGSPFFGYCHGFSNFEPKAVGQDPWYPLSEQELRAQRRPVSRLSDQDWTALEVP